MKALLLLIRLWRMCISPLLGCNCRYAPSCSVYMEESLIEHGLFRGLCFGILRICRCNSLFQGGYDPVNKRKAHDRR